MNFHIDGSRPANGEIFVFGSNLGGIHGAGAAAAARKLYGAQMFVGVGPAGRSYAIPTKNEDITRSLPIKVIEVYVEQFLAYARMAEYFWDTNVGLVTPNRNFFVTAIGCGLAGYRHADIAPLFKNVPNNVSLPDSWKAFV